MGRKRSSGNEGLGEYVQWRDGKRLELRFPLPLEARQAFLDKQGRPSKQVIVSLGTNDIRLANAKADLIRADIRRKIIGVQQARQSPDLDGYLRDLYADELAAFDRQMSADARTSLLGVRSHHADARLADRRGFAKALLSDDPDERSATAGWAAAEFLRRQGRDPDLDPEFDEIVDRCAAVLVDALTAQNELAAGRAAPTPTSLMITSATKTKRAALNASGERGELPISRYFSEVYLPATQTAGAFRGQNTVSGKAQAVDLFVDLRADLRVGEITKADLWTWHDDLLKLPNSREIPSAYRNLTPRKQIEAHQLGKFDAATINPKTVNKHLSGIKTLLDFAESRQDITLSPSHRVKAKVALGEETGRPFTTDELNRIFSQPLFSGCSEGLLPDGLFKPGPIAIRDDRFWAPLLMLFTGARPSEIVGLETSDVVVDHEVPHILIVPNATRGLKNTKSRRMVPIHERLITLGFLDFARDQERQTQSRFFPMAEQQYYIEKPTGEVRKKGLSSSLMMRQFNVTILKNADARADGGSAKCFRNTFEQEAMAQIPSDEIRRRITGRDVKSTVQIYTQNIPTDPLKRTAQLRMLACELNRISYDGVELGHLDLTAAAPEQAGIAPA